MSGPCFYFKRLKDINTSINLWVQIGYKSAQTVALDYGGETYVVVPCDYFSVNTNVTISNVGECSVTIDYFNYTVVDSVVERSEYDSSIKEGGLLNQRFQNEGKKEVRFKESTSCTAILKEIIAKENYKKTKPRARNVSLLFF